MAGLLAAIHALFWAGKAGFGGAPSLPAPVAAPSPLCGRGHCRRQHHTLLGEGVGPIDRPPPSSGSPPLRVGDPPSPTRGEGKSQRVIASVAKQSTLPGTWIASSLRSSQ